MKKDFIHKKLKNGIDVYLYSDKDLKRVCASISVNYGTSGYYDKFYYDGKEYSATPAMAHFLEHTLIEKSPNGNMQHVYTEKNYDSNGMTYPHLTTYYFVGIGDERGIKKSIKELVEMVEKPVFDADDIEDVKSAICEELKKTGDSSYQLARSQIRHNLYSAFDAVPIDNNILGSVEATMAITLEEARLCYDAYYNDENKTIVIGGAIDVDDMMDYLESIYKDIGIHPKNMREYDYGDLMPIRERSAIIEHARDAETAMRIYKIKDTFGLSKLKTDLYIYIFLRLKFASSTKFVESLSRMGKIVGGLSHSNDYFKDILLITLAFESYSPDEVFDLIGKELNADNLDKNEFELTKRALVADEIRRRDYIYRAILRFPQNLEYTEHMSEVETIKSLDYDEMIELIKKLKFDLYSTTIVKDKKD